MAPRSESAGGAPAARSGGPTPLGPDPGEFRAGGPADGGDAAAFLGRVTALDPGALVRLRDGGGRVTGYAQLPFGVLVSRTVAGSVRPADVTVTAADLLGAVEPLHGRGGKAPLPASRDMAWRAALPPLSGWQRLDEVPGDVIRSLVRAGAETLRAVPADATASAGESLLDHEALTVSAGDRTVAVPLRALTALAKMGFLGRGAGGGAQEPTSWSSPRRAAGSGWPPRTARRTTTSSRAWASARAELRRSGQGRTR